MAVQGYINDECTLTLCRGCMEATKVAGERWVKFPSNFDNDNCTECYEEIGALS